MRLSQHNYIHSVFHLFNCSNLDWTKEIKSGAVAGLILARSLRRFGIDHSGLVRLGEKQHHFSDPAPRDSDKPGPIKQN
jgi:hypothetical protein